MPLSATPVPLRRVLLAVAAGGALGSCLRAVLGALVTDPAAWPWDTLAVNVVGCFALALLPAVGAVRRSAVLTAMLGAGVLGGFTTLSAWSEETRALVAAGEPGLGAAYVLLTLVGCLLAVAAGRRVTRYVGA